MTFDGFISYSHAADGRLAPAVQRGLHRLAKPWHRRRALWIFRDQTGLAVTPSLWSSIQTALDGSEYFVLLASPEAAESKWVNREIEHWIATKSADRVLPVVTDGEWAWDNDRKDFTEESTAVPPALRGVFTEEPFFLDLRWARGSEHLSLHHSRFRDAIAQLAAPMHGVSKDELEGEDVRQHRRARRVRSGVAATLVVMALLATLTGVSAVHNAERAKTAAAEALRQQQVADSQRDSAQRSAQEATRQQQLAQQQQDLAKQQKTRAAEAAAKADQSEKLARHQQDLADQAAAEAKHQQDLADRAAKRTKREQQLAKEAADRAKAASDRAKKLQAEAKRQAAAAAEQRRLADQAAAEAKAQQAKADQQQRIAVSRRLMNQATASVVNDPPTAMMLGAAAQSINNDPETRGQLTGVVMSSRFAGRIENVRTAVYGRSGIVASVGTDYHVRLYDVTDPTDPVRLATLPGTTLPDEGPGFTNRSPIFTSDGRTLAFVDGDAKTELWDVAWPSHPSLLAVVPEPDEVTTMAFSGDGTALATGDDAGNTFLWDTTDRAHPVLRWTDTGYQGRGVVHLTISPDGRLLLIDKILWDFVYDISDRAHPVIHDRFLDFGGSPTIFSPDGMTVAAPLNQSVYLYNIGERYYGVGDPWIDMRARARSLADPEPTTTGSPDEPQPPTNTPSLPDPDDDDDGGSSPPPPLPSLPPVYDDSGPMDGAIGNVTSAAWSPDGSYLVAGDDRGGLTRYGVNPWNDVPVTWRSPGPVNSVSFDPAGGKLVTADGSATATLWNMTPPAGPVAQARLNVPMKTDVNTVFSANGRSLTAVGSGGTANTWDLSDPAHPVRGADLKLTDEAIGSAEFSPDDRTAAIITTGEGTLTLVDTKHPGSRTTVTTGARSVKFSPDGRTLAVDADPGTLMLWDVADRAHPVRLSTTAATDIAGDPTFSPDGRTLAFLAPGGATFVLWDISHRAAPVRLATVNGGHTGMVTSLAFSPNGRNLVSIGLDGNAVLWDLGDRVHPHRTVILSTGTPLYDAAFSPDGRTLATADSRNVVTLWDVTAPGAPVRLATATTSTGGAAWRVAFSNDGHTLAITSQSTTATVSLWSYAALNKLRADPAATACTIAGRGLTAEEWASYVPEVPYRRSCAP
jgi:WD40 repeat protein